jgi:glycosyltransferase involved in cell wall biosynthesis
VAKVIRVAHFADLVNRYDFIDNVVRHLDRERFAAHVVTWSRSSNIADPRYEETDVSNVILEVSGKADYPLAAWRLHRYCRDNRIDVLHAHHFWPNLIAALAASIPGGPALVVGRQYSDFVFRYTSGAKRHALLGIESFVHRRARAIVVPAPSVRSLLVDRQGVDPAKVHVVPYPFDLARFGPLPPERRAELRNSLGVEDSFAVFTAARIHRAKGLDVVVEALADLASRLPRVVWLLAGEGPERASLENELAARRLCDNARLLGWRRDVPDLMSAADVVAQPSEEEGFGQVIVEALWAKTPLVTTVSSGAAQYLDDRRDALLIPPSDPVALADSIEELAGDPDLRASLAEAGARRVADTFAIEAVLPPYEALYETICEAARQGRRWSLHR